MTGLDFTVAAFALSGVDAQGVKWTTTAVRGWHGGPPMRSDRQSKSQRAGSWPSQGHSGERVVTLTGVARADDTAAIEAAGRRFAAVLADGGAGDLVGVSDYGVLTAAVALDDEPSFELISGRHATWALTLAAPDPLLYGPATYGSATLASATPGAGRVWPRVWPTDYGIAPGVTPGAVAVPNAGTAAYWPRLRIDGPVLNPVVSLVEGGAWVRFTGSLAAGQWLDLDMYNRRVLLQGQVSVREKVTSSGNWLAISPGGGSVVWTADTADPAALLHVFGYERAVS